MYVLFFIRYNLFQGSISGVSIPVLTERFSRFASRCKLMTAAVFISYFVDVGVHNESVGIRVNNLGCCYVHEVVYEFFFCVHEVSSGR